MNRHLLVTGLVLGVAEIFSACNDSSTLTSVVPYSPQKVSYLSNDLSLSCSANESPYFSCGFDATFPNDEAQVVKDKIEISFGAVNNKPAIINPTYRKFFSLLGYDDAMFTSFMLTGISSLDFDTMKTDALFRDLTPADYYLNLTGNMNCIFFRSANGNYGLINIGSASGSNSNFNPVRVSFDVKYVDVAQ